jgi:nicotinate-nucleotide adenylyltransferase
VGARTLGDGLTARDDAPSAVRSGLPRPATVVRGSIGILGGTFDPIHIGHLASAEEAREALGFERVLFVPAAVPPHKTGQPRSSAQDRAAMVVLAIAGNPVFELSRIELDRPGPSYSVDTVATLLEAAAASTAGGLASPPDGAPTYTFILSTEAVAGLPSWHEPQRLLDLCRMAVVPRGDLARPDQAWLDEAFPGRADRFTFLDGPRLEISGSAIRERVRTGRSIRYLVPEAVRAYIDDHGLYQGPTWRNA